MNEFDWNTINSEVFVLDRIPNRVNADKLFAKFLTAIEKQGINYDKIFTVEEVVSFIPKGTANVNNYATYGFSIMSMFSKQKDRDYFIFTNDEVAEDLTSVCNNNYDRDNYYWKKKYADEKVRINPKYVKKVDEIMEKSKAGNNEKLFKDYFESQYGTGILQGKCSYTKGDVYISVDNSIEYKDKRVLIEIDSGNEAKLLVGQYTLLNVLCEEEKELLFVVIHYYKDKKIIGYITHKELFPILS